MQTQRIVLSLAVAIVGIGAAVPASSQEYRGTWEQQMACTPDVWRLCGDQIPDVSRIVACLRQNTPQLSADCRAVFETSAEQREPRARVPQQQNVPRYRAPQAAPPPVQRQPWQPQPWQPRPYYEEDE